MNPPIRPNIIRPVHGMKHECTTTMPTIFLAGPTNRDGLPTPWREEAVELIAKFADTPMTVFLPEQFVGDYDQQCDWEFEARGLANCILFWVPRNIVKGYPAFTTNVEFGYDMVMKPEQVVLGYPEDAEKMRYFDYMWRRTWGDSTTLNPIYHDLSEAVKEAITRACDYYQTVLFPNGVALHKKDFEISGLNQYV